jgi:hypothetical protein
MAVKPTAINDTLLPIVTSVQRLLAEDKVHGQKTIVPPLQHAAKNDSLEFAQRVVERFLASQGDALRRGIEPHDVSESLLKLLLEEDGQRKALRNQWTDLRNAVRQASVRLGAALEAMHETVRSLGLGYRPTLIELAAKLRAQLGQIGGPASLTVQHLEQWAKSGELATWQAALLRLWSSRREGSSAAALSDEALEALFLDADALEELAAAGEGPWDAYVAQAAALRAYRHLGAALVQLSP